MKISAYSTRAQMMLCAVLSGCAAPPTAPGPVRVPSDQELLRQLHATGVQVYQCQPAKNDASKWEWTFKQPEARLSSSMGTNIGRHYAGPTWEANDGSKVTGEVIGRSESSKPNSIPLLLLRAKATSGSGIFSGVQYIQRLNTVGGNAPTVACRSEQVGQELRASYTADYLFYGVKH
jgi:Protein of unknown function (DUF3455)